MSKTINRRYMLHIPVGSGPMATVYQAQDKLSGRTLALKYFGLPIERLRVNDSPGALTKLQLVHAMRMLSSLRHPALIGVGDYGFDHADGTDHLYYTSDLLTDVRPLLATGRDQSLEDKLRLIVPVLHVLIYLHRRNVLHRNLKAENIFSDGRQTYVTDAGLSLALASENHDRLPVAVLAHLAPELLAGRSASVASDLYAFGLLLYELLAGRFPYQRNNATELLTNIRYFMPDVNALGLQPTLAHVISRLLSKDASDRYPTALETLQALESASGLSLMTVGDNTRDAYLRSSRMVGRDGEFEQLSNALKNALTGSGSSWLLTGDSGLGKTRLVEEISLQAQADDALILRGGALQTAGPPYVLWRNIARWLALDETLTAPQQAALRLLASEPLAGDEPQTDQALSNAFLAALTKATQETAIVIVLEDLQWVNSECLDLLEQVSALATSTRLLVLTTARTDLAPNLAARLNNSTELALRKLSVRYISELTQQLLGPAGELPIVNALLYRETEGNAFFLLEVMRTLAEQVGDLGMIGIKTLPDQLFVGGIAEAVERRLDRVPEAYHRVLALMALAGDSVDLALLRDLSEGLDPEKVLYEAHEAAVLDMHDDQWAFSHDRIWQGAANRVEDADRRSWHARIAASMATHHSTDTSYAAALAWHYGLAGDQEQERVYVAQAADLSHRSDALNDAIEQYERLLALTPQPEQRAAILVALATCYERAGIEGRALALLNEARSLAQTYRQPTEEAASLLGLANAARQRGDLNEARQYLEEVPAGSSQQYASALMGLGNLASEQGNAADAITWFEKALTVPGLSPAQRIGTLLTVGLSHTASGQAEQAVPLLTEALELTHDRQPHEAMRAATGLAAAYQLRGAYDAALACLVYALNLALDARDLLGIARAIGSIAYTEMRAQRLNYVEVATQLAIRLAHAAEQPMLAAGYEYNLGLFYLENFLLAEALTRFAEAQSLASADTLSATYQQAAWLQAYVGSLLGLHEPDEAAAFIAATLSAETPAALRISAAYWQCRIEGENTDQVAQTAAALRSAYEQTPTVELSQRYTDLTGETLPTPAPLPELPALLVSLPMDIDVLIERVELFAVTYDL